MVPVFVVGTFDFANPREALKSLTRPYKLCIKVGFFGGVGWNKFFLVSRFNTYLADRHPVFLNETTENKEKTGKLKKNYTDLVLRWHSQNNLNYKFLSHM
jgi:hypothetical protein